MTKPAAIILGLSLLTAARPGAADWSREIVETGGDFGYPRSSVAWHGGNPAIAFVRGTRLYYAERAAGTWTIESVGDSDCGNSAAMAMDASGDPSIAYSNDGVRIARRIGGVWTSTRVADGKAVGHAYTPAGDPVVSYCLFSPAAIGVATGGGSGWTLESIPAGFPNFCADSSLGIDGGGEPWVSFTDDSNYDGRPDTVQVAHRVGGTFTATVVAWTAPQGADLFSRRTSLTFDAAGVLALAYYEMAGDCANSTNIRVWHSDGTSWSTETAVVHPACAGGLSLVLEPAGNLVVAYGSEPDGGIYLARKGPSSWAIESVSAAGRGPVLAFSPSGTPAVGYLAEYPTLLSVAIRSGAGWTSEDIAATLGRFHDPALALESGSLPVIAYFDRDRAVRYARSTPGGWELETVAPISSPSYLSLRLDPSGNPRLALWSAGRIELARRDGTLPWSVDTVVPDQAGAWFSLALDPAGNPAISYMCCGPRAALKLTRWDGAAWSTEVVDATVVAPNRPSLAFDPAGNPLVAYTAGLDYILKFARWDGSSWDLSIVDASPHVGWESALAIDPAGNPAIAYRDEPNRAIKLARWSGSSWSLETVASSDRLLAFAFDRDGSPAIVHLESLAELLWLARKAGATWSQELVDRGWINQASLAFGASGDAFVAYQDPACFHSIMLARESGPLLLYRGVVATLDAGWQASALPLSSVNDDETAPFPIAAIAPGMTDDPLPDDGAALVLYRVLADGDRPAGNTLRAVRTPTGVGLEF